MDTLYKFLENLDIEKEISVEDFPDIDLYMDQVIQLFEKKFSGTKRSEDEKVLTKTMINNYAKAGLLFPIKNKKYTKEHLIMLCLIYQLKGVLSINDIKNSLEPINIGFTKGEFDFYHFYESYQKLIYKNVEYFVNHLDENISQTKETVANINDNHSKEIERVLLITSLCNLSNLYKRAAEQLIDELIERD